MEVAEPVKEVIISEVNKRYISVLEKKNYTGYQFVKESIDLSESVITNIRKGKNEPSKKYIDALLQKFPDVSRVWLMTGFGEMFSNGDPVRVDTKTKLEIKKNEIEYDNLKRIPFYNLNISAGNVTFEDNGLLHNMPPDDYMYIPAQVDADVSFPTYGDSMYPEITNGDWVAYKFLKDWSFFNYGMMYLIATAEQRMVKYIKRHEKEGYILLESRNEAFEPIDMPITSIKSILQVRYIGKIKM